MKRIYCEKLKPNPYLKPFYSDHYMKIAVIFSRCLSIDNYSLNYLP